MRTLRVRYFRPILPSARRADRPAAAGRVKFPVKVQLCRTFTPLPRDTCPEPPLPCRGEGGIVSGFFGTGNVSRGDSVPPGLLQKKRADAKHLLSGNSILAELLLLSACSLRLLAALDARAFLMLTLTELGKRTRLCTRTLETTQCAVNRFIFLDADLRHSFPSLRAFLYGGRFAQLHLPQAHKTVRILYLFFPPVSTKIFHERADFAFFILRPGLRSCPGQRSA